MSTRKSDVWDIEGFTGDVWIDVWNINLWLISPHFDSPNVWFMFIIGYHTPLHLQFVSKQAM